MKTQNIFRYIPLFCLAVSSTLLNAAENAPKPATPPASPVQRQHPLVFDKMVDIYKASPGENIGKFSFWVTNTGPVDVIINNVNASCGCTVAQLPASPWKLAPGEFGEIKSSMNFSGKTGTLEKNLTVVSSGGPQQVLTVRALVPEIRDEKTRQANLMAAIKDKQSVFKNDCASCHVEPLKGKKGAELFVAGCNICHEPPNGGKRADIVPDLRKLAFPTDAAYWKRIIKHGKDNSLMPAFGIEHGGPLTDEEIDSLVEYAVKTYTFTPPELPKKTTN